MKSVTGTVVALFGLAVLFAGPAVYAEEKEIPPAFTKATLEDPKNIATGKEIWIEQCGLCHGAKSYPGKAPKLKPRRYKPDFVFRRVTKGFRKMPAWQDVYTRDERIAIVAYIMSKDFSP